MKTLGLLTLTLVVVLFSFGCARPQGRTAQSQVQYIDQMAQNTLDEFYENRPGMEQRIDQVPGYGIFSNVGGQVLFIGAEQGYGVVVNNQTGERTYMKMGGLRGGFGLGATNFRAVFVFNDADVLDDFVTSGWDFGAEAGAAAKTSPSRGGEVGTSGSLRAIDVYQITDSGVIAAATVSGTKYWKDADLNLAARGVNGNGTRDRDRNRNRNREQYPEFQE